MTDDLHRFAVTLSSVRDRDYVATFDAAERAHHEADPHQYVTVRLDFDYTKPTTHTRQQVLDAYVWAAGLIARLVLEVEWNVRARNHGRGLKDQDPCRTAFGYLGSCGTHRICGAVSDPRNWTGVLHPPWTDTLDWDGDLHEPPEVDIFVPTEDATRWTALIRSRLAHLATSDLTPLGVTTATEHDSTNPAPARPPTRRATT